MTTVFCLTVSIFFFKKNKINIRHSIMTTLFLKFSIFFPDFQIFPTIVCGAMSQVGKSLLSLVPTEFKITISNDYHSAHDA